MVAHTKSAKLKSKVNDLSRRNKKLTQSSRKHAFKSFRDRIDSIKIEPSHNLNRRVYDDVEDTSSHFISTLQHWLEVNLSGNFTEFVYETRSVTKSLPQIIHHQEKIFNSLYMHIEKYDPHSIQPLLELLSQFIHDLGSDFMAYYEKTLKLLTSIALDIKANDLQNNVNSSNLLEWIFNCVTFIFKYLSRDLVKNFRSTFDILLPILTLNKQQYISRFCSEAISFIIKKMKSEQLEEVVNYLLIENSNLLEENITFKDSLIVIFSQAIISTKESFHSKSSVIYTELIKVSFKNLSSNIIISGVLANIFFHGNTKTITPFVEITLDYISANINGTSLQLQKFLNQITEILITLVFSESGKKTEDWDSLVGTVLTICDHIAASKNVMNIDSILFCLSLIIRNCEPLCLNKNFKKISQFLVSYNRGLNAIPFLDSTSKICEKKLVSLGFINTIQDFVNKSENNEDALKQLSLFLLKNQDSDISIPAASKSSILSTISLESTDPQNLFDIYWKLHLFKNEDLSNSSLSFSKFLLSLPVDNLFVADFIGIICAFLQSAEDIDEYVIYNFQKLKKSSKFLKSFIALFVKMDIPKDQALDMVSSVVENLSCDDTTLRLCSIDFIMGVFNHYGIAVPEYVSSMKAVETIPLTISNSRDITLRIRLLVTSFVQEENKNDLDCQIITQYLFGVMTNKFQPCWEAVLDNLPRIVSICETHIWNHCYKFLIMNFNDPNPEYLGFNDDFMQVDSDESQDEDLLFNDERITSTFNNMLTNSYSPFRSPVLNILEISRESSPNLIYEERIRNLILQALVKVHEVAEMHSDDLLPFILDDEKARLWIIKDRNILLTILSKFKSLNKLKESDELYSKLLNVLTSQRLASQKLALDVILSYKHRSVNKYKENLRNLLDDTLFKDELTKFLTNDKDSSIEEQDLEDLFPLILRILFGRVQGGTNSNSKTSKKNAVINILPMMSEEQITAFLKLGSDKIGFKDVNSITPEDLTSTKRLNGYVTLLSELYGVLGFNFKDALTTTVEPLIYSMTVAQLKIDSIEDISNNLEDIDSDADENDDDNDDNNEDENLNQDTLNDVKSAKKIRQLGMRCLNELFKILGQSYNWEQHFDSIYQFIIKPRLKYFDRENLQQPSSLLNILVSWIKLPTINKFLLIDDLKPARAIISLIENRKAKNSVVSVSLGFAIDCLKSSFSEDEAFVTLLALLVESLLKNISAIIDSTLDSEIINKSVTLLLLLIDGDYIVDDYTRNSLIDSLTNVFSKPPNKIATDERERILISLSVLINSYTGSFDDFLHYYEVLSKSFRVYKEISIRTNLVDVFKSIGSKFVELEKIGDLLAGMNSYALNSSGNRIGEPDYDSVLSAYKDINEELYSTFNTIQWLPIVYSALFFVNDEEELIIRTNAGYVLNRFVDAYSALDTEEAASKYIELWKNVILSDIRDGLKATVEVVQTEYISILEYCVKHSKHFTELDDMKVLLFNDTDEANFFVNINHIQLHRRQKAIRRVGELRESLRPTSISHYILPIIEGYAYTQDEKMRNVGNDAVASLGLLVRNLSWNQLKSFFKKYISKLRVANPENLKTCVNVVVEVSRSLFSAIDTKRSDNSAVDTLKEFPKDPEAVDSFVLEEIMPVLQKILNERNDETIVSRITLSEALVNLVKCISQQKVDEQLPGLLTSTCQVLRSRSEELRDASRKSLCKIARSLGAKYFKFLVQELKSALTRGSQIHVLSFTVHALLVSVQDILEHGDLDESIGLIVEVIMEDVFGAAGQEKDAEGYTSKMKEVRHKKSNDSGEILTANISLTEFNGIIDPVKLILQERISLKVQNKLDELLKRYALGLNHNEESNSRNILILSYQINHQSTNVFDEDSKNTNKNQKIQDKYNNENTKDHFLVTLNAKPLKTQVNFAQYKFTLQKFSFELLRAAISRHPSLLTVSNLQQFIPLLDEGINSDHEGLVATCFRLLHTVIQLPFSEETNMIFKKCARKALTIVKDSPNTTSELCQSCLKFLATLIRHRSEINLKDTAISYVLVKIQPDLEEPKTQGLAFNFLKAVVSRHVLLPEVYDIMEIVSKIMVVNHNREIRDVSRSIYFQFLMEYDQGRGRLEKQFKFLVSNLGYATQEGRQSVLELVNSIVNGSGQDLLSKVSISFFVALANILVNDDSSRCREMTSLIIQNILAKLDPPGVESIEKYLFAWLRQDGNAVLLRCALTVYKIYLDEFGLGKNKELDDLASSNINLIFTKSSRQSYEEVDESEEIEWQLVYTALNVFSSICSKEKKKIVGKQYENIWKSIINTLLFPHSWVRLSASKLIAILLANLDDCGFVVDDYEIQTIAYRLLHQMGAPGISEALGNQAIKNLISIAKKWETNQTGYIFKTTSIDEQADDDQEENQPKYQSACEFLCVRACAIIRQELNNSLVSKKSAIKLCAMLTQIYNGDLLYSSVKKIISALYYYTENGQESNIEPDLIELATECLLIVEKKIGGSQYTDIYAQVQKEITLRRQERRTKRAQLAVSNPEVAANRKLKKHARFREKRKHVKDENGYYHSKRKRRV